MSTYASECCWLCWQSAEITDLRYLQTILICPRAAREWVSVSHDLYIDVTENQGAGVPLGPLWSSSYINWRFIWQVAHCEVFSDFQLANLLVSDQFSDTVLVRYTVLLWSLGTGLLNCMIWQWWCCMSRFDCKHCHLYLLCETVLLSDCHWYIYLFVFQNLLSILCHQTAFHVLCGICQFAFSKVHYLLFSLIWTCMPCYVRWLIHVTVPLLFLTYVYHTAIVKCYLSITQRRRNTEARDNHPLMVKLRGSSAFSP